MSKMSPEFDEIAHDPEPEPDMHPLDRHAPGNSHCPQRCGESTGNDYQPHQDPVGEDCTEDVCARCAKCKDCGTDTERNRP